MSMCQKLQLIHSHCDDAGSHGSDFGSIKFQYLPGSVCLLTKLAILVLYLLQGEHDVIALNTFAVESVVRGARARPLTLALTKQPVQIKQRLSQSDLDVCVAPSKPGWTDLGLNGVHKVRQSRSNHFHGLSIERQIMVHRAGDWACREVAD